MNRVSQTAKLTALPVDSLAMAMTVAAQAIVQVMRGQALNDGFASLWQSFPDLPQTVRATVQDLVYGTLRDHERSGFLLSKLLHTPLSEQQVEALLRIALHRLEQRPQTAHTVVNQAVEAAARMARGGLKGLVNGVLRNALRQWDELLVSASTQEVAHWRHPQWWIDAVRLAEPTQWESVLQAANTHPPMSVRVNPQRAVPEDAWLALTRVGHAIEPLGSHAARLVRPIAVSALPGYAEGHLSVQDWGAQQAAMLLDLADGQRVLDACAAPGGKSAHILELAKVDLTALDVDSHRATRVLENLARLGLSAKVQTADARHVAKWWDGRPFDRILADVPCSASGVARRHPDIKWLRQSDDIANFATLQAEILDALWPSLALGGKMLYVTCSLFAAENSEQISRFTARHADCQRVPFDDGALERRWLPTTDHDGFYFALLQKTPSPGS